MNNTIECQDRFDYFHMSYHQVLSEEFMRENKDEVNWYFISYRQKLSSI